MGRLHLGRNQAKALAVEPRVQQSPLMELCCLRMSAKASYRQAERDVELLTGIGVSAKTQERIVERHAIDAAPVEEPVEEVALDGGMVRLIAAPGEGSRWKQYKAVRLNGNGMGMAWFEQNQQLIDWLQSLPMMSLFYCLGDGHPGIWSLFSQLERAQISDEILDWFHLIENLHKVDASDEQLAKAESLLWWGKVEQTLTLMSQINTHRSHCFRAYIQNHRGRLPNYGYYQMEGWPISSSSVESWIKQIDERLQITGARWKPERVPQMLALRGCLKSHTTRSNQHVSRLSITRILAM